MPESSPLSIPALRFFGSSRSALFCILAGILTLWHLHVINRAMPPNKADMVAVWKGVQAAFNHQNPYSDATTRGIQVFYYGRPLGPADRVNPMAYAYPMHAIMLFAPIAALPWNAVRLGFFVLLPILTAASVVLWLRVLSIELDRYRMATITGFAICSFPVMWGVHQIQPTLVVAFLAAAVCFLLVRGRSAWSGAVLAMATIKPQLIGGLALWIALWALRRRLWSFFLGFGAALTLLLLPCFAMLPDWVPRWRTAMAEYTVYRHLRLELGAIFGHSVGLVLAATAVAAASWTGWENRGVEASSPRFGEVCALVLATTVCVLPTEFAMTYNYVFLIPGCLLLMKTRRSGGPSELFRAAGVACIWWTFLSVAISFVGESLIRPSAFWDELPFVTFFLPVCVLAALLVPRWYTKNSEGLAFSASGAR